MNNIVNYKNIKYLEQLRNEINVLLSKECYLSAVNNAMIILDSMTKSNNFPYCKNKESDRFIHFCDDCLKSKDEIGLTGEELYSIRNFMFHEGFLNINTKKTKLNSIYFYINKGKIHSSTIMNNNDTIIANIDISTLTSLIINYFDKYKNNLTLSEIVFLY